MLRQKTRVYGFELLFDGYGADKDKLADITLMYDVLESLPPLIGMRKIGFPHIVSIDEPGIVGLSGFIFIIESHISIHTYKEQGFITANVYSCKAFDHSTAAEFLARKFGAKSVESILVKRGKQFPVGSSS